MDVPHAAHPAGEEYFLFDERYAEAMLHRPGGHVVMGKRLKPFCLWHRLQLEYVNSKVLLGGATLWDLWGACRICQTSYPERAEWGPWRPMWHFAWRVKYGVLSLLRPGYMKRQMDAFVAYYRDYCSYPKTWGGKGSAVGRLGEALVELGEALGDENVVREGLARQADAQRMGEADRDIDDTLEKVGGMVKMTGLPPERVWNMPEGEMSWVFVAVAKAEGAKIEIWTPTHERMYEHHKAKRGERIAAVAEEIKARRTEAGEEQESDEITLKRAAVEYWEQVVQRVLAGK